MSDPVLTIDGLTVSLPPWSDRKHAVSNLSLAIGKQEIVCVVGESGSGKSIMGKAILGLLPKPHVRATGGRIMLEGRDLLQLPDEDMRRLRGGRIAMIFQEPMTALNPLMKVGRQVEEVLEFHTDLKPSARRARVLQLMADVHLPDAERMVNSYPHQLSGGQRQRIVIAMALALEPALIIADEPTTALDVTTQAQILHLIRELQRAHGTSVLFITHDFGVVAEIADRVAVMRHGEVVEAGTADAVLRSPQADYTKALIAAVPGLRPRVKDAGTQMPLLVVRDLEKTYVSSGSFGRASRSVKAVDKVSLQLGRQASLALVGESGSGKSTLARCIIGLETPNAGEVLLDGERITGLSREQLRPHRRQMQMVFQDPFASLNPRHRVRDIVALPLRAQGRLDRAEMAKRVAEMLERVGLSAEQGGRLPSELSGGQRQRVAIARALVLRPRIVVCDEPTSALDVSVQAQILNLLAELRRELQLTYLFISHNLAVVEHVATEVAVMYLGRIVEQARTAELFRAPRHPYTKALLASVLTPEPGLGVPDVGLGDAMPDPANVPPGCRFHPRCPVAVAQCGSAAPAPSPRPSGTVECHLAA
ncbi:MAG: ABC transporter ATP-binding protein [Hyphomicrobiaceae bacterium]|nr:ABC transporter ATP-binding protein [Hyphomicrobiaceae bacterium]